MTLRAPRPPRRTRPAAPIDAGAPAVDSGARPSITYRVSDKRDAIVAAALQLFVERGFWGTAVPEIAERAKVGAGTIYRYFVSKEALVNEIYQQAKQRFAATVLERFPAQAPAREQFRAIWMGMAEFATRCPGQFVFLELHHHASYLDAASRKVEQQMLAMITAVIEAAQRRGELKAGAPRLLVGVVMGAFVGVIRSCVDAAEAPRAADWVFAEQCVWEAIRS
jgi:TetR/AcrR family transcriptional regulator, repressor of fatR-cypB operon